MRRILFTILIIVMLHPTGVRAATPNFYLDSDKETLEKQETIYISVHLSESLHGNYRNIQGKILYDTDMFSYVSHEMGTGYEHYVAMDMKEKGFFAFSNTDFTPEGFSEVKKGPIVTIVLQAKKVPRKTKQTTIDLTVDLQNTNGDSETFTNTIAFAGANGKAMQEGNVEHPLRADEVAKADESLQVEESAKVDEAVKADAKAQPENKQNNDDVETIVENRYTTDQVTGNPENHAEEGDSQIAMESPLENENQRTMAFWLLGIGGAVVIAGCIYKKWIRNKERSE